MSGFLTPSNTTMNGAITAGLAQFGGVDTRNMWGLPQLGRWKWHDPNVHVQLLVDNNTRLWVFSPATLTCSDPAAMIGYCDQAQGSNRSFYQHYRRSAATTGTSTSRPAASTTGAAGGRSWPRCRAIWPPRSSSHRRQANRGAESGQPVPWRRAADGTAVGRADGRPSLVASAAALLSGCAVTDDMMATIALPTSETAQSGADAQAGAPPVLTPSRPPGAQSNSMIVTGQQRAYLDALTGAGVQPSSDLLALSIGSYVCQARAAKQSDQAVWDFVLPLVRSDVRDAQRSSLAPPAA